MEFLSVRELKNSSKDVWKRLAKQEKMVITNNGKPVALMLNLYNEDLENVLEIIRRAKMMGLFNKVQMKSVRRELRAAMPPKRKTA